jgi:hypothetical protein
MKKTLIAAVALAGWSFGALAQTNAPTFDLPGPKVGDTELGTQQKLLSLQGRANVIDVDATKSNTVDLPHAVTALYVTVSGTVKFDMSGSGTATITLPVGMWTGFNIKRVYVTGTTATGLFGFY